MIDAVLTHPHHPSLCGVVKFSVQLAAHLGVPCYRDLSAPAQHPLYSIKGSEEQHFLPSLRAPGTFDVFAHDATGMVWPLAARARHVFAANRVLAREITASLGRPVVAAWCPSLLQGNASRGLYNVLTFGMAHKLQVARYVALKQELDAQHPDYTVSVSTAVHEGSPWDATAEVADELRAIFGDKLRVLGYLADDALAMEMRECDAIAIYFEDGVRENNTTWHAALQSGKRIYTNTDAFSPSPHEAMGMTWKRLRDRILERP
jgi:hypothetical protein